MFLIVGRQFWHIHVTNTNYISIKLILQTKISQPWGGDKLLQYIYWYFNPCQRNLDDQAESKFHSFIHTFTPSSIHSFIGSWWVAYYVPTLGPGRFGPSPSEEQRGDEQSSLDFYLLPGSNANYSHPSSPLHRWLIIELTRQLRNRAGIRTSQHHIFSNTNWMSEWSLISRFNINSGATVSMCITANPKKQLNCQAVFHQGMLPKTVLKGHLKNRLKFHEVFNANELEVLAPASAGFAKWTSSK